MSFEKKADQIREQLMTYEDYFALPEDGNRYELTDGVLELMTPSPSIIHQWVSSEIQYILRSSCNEDYIILVAPIDVILSQREVRQPDIVVIHRSRIDIITKRGIEGSPDLIIEILSPTSIKRDRHMKQKVYAQYGIREYWIVDPEYQTLERFILNEQSYVLKSIYKDDDLIQSEIIPCASFTMQEIMARIPELK